VPRKDWWGMKFDFKSNRDWVNHFTIVMQLGLTMVGSIAFCFIIGFYLDRWLHSKGIFTAVFIILGVVGGAVTVYRQIMEVIEDGKNDHDTDLPH
jgi:F0F1-type ATP synthase assembly protein I